MEYSALAGATLELSHFGGFFPGSKPTTTGSVDEVGDTRVIDLPDGRELSWAEFGDPAGQAVLCFHGTPGSRRQMAVAGKAAQVTGVRLICPDRPGYGLSTYQRDRRLVGWAEDVRLLADYLGLDRFFVMGISGGGPHAAACACLLPDRVRTAGLVSGVGPLDHPGSEEGMLGFNRVMTRVTRRAPALILPFYALITSASKRWPEQALDAFGRQLPACDAEVVARGEVRAAYADDLRHASRSSARAAVQDFALFAHDWGFRLEDIALPVHLWHGDKTATFPSPTLRFRRGGYPERCCMNVLGRVTCWPSTISKTYCGS